MAQLTHLAHRLYEHVRREELLPRGAHVVVACSGGPDSLTLLSLLLELRPLLSLTVTAAHYEHGIRGEASAEDAAFVRRFCAARAVPCIVERGDVPRAAARTSESLETAARRLRYAFLERTRERRWGISPIRQLRVFQKEVLSNVYPARLYLIKREFPDSYR